MTEPWSAQAGHAQDHYACVVGGGDDHPRTNTIGCGRDLLSAEIAAALAGR